MATEAVAREIAQQISPLVRKMRDGRDEILCPHCGHWGDVLSFKSLSMMERFIDDLNPIIKCGHCGHAFAPRFLATTRVRVLADDGLDDLGSTVGHHE